MNLSPIRENSGRISSPKRQSPGSMTNERTIRISVQDHALDCMRATYWTENFFSAFPRLATFAAVYEHEHYHQSRKDQTNNLQPRQGLFDAVAQTRRRFSGQSHHRGGEGHRNG